MLESFRVAQECLASWTEQNSGPGPSHTLPYTKCHKAHFQITKGTWRWRVAPYICSHRIGPDSRSCSSHLTQKKTADIAWHVLASDCEIIRFSWHQIPACSKWSSQCASTPVHLQCALKSTELSDRTLIHVVNLLLYCAVACNANMAKGCQRINRSARVVVSSGFFKTLGQQRNPWVVDPAKYRLSIPGGALALHIWTLGSVESCPRSSKTWGCSTLWSAELFPPWPQAQSVLKIQDIVKKSKESRNSTSDTS